MHAIHLSKWGMGVGAMVQQKVQARLKEPPSYTGTSRRRKLSDTGLYLKEAGNRGGQDIEERCQARLTS